jgi:ribosomal protein S12 methylthiotransferase
MTRPSLTEHLFMTESHRRIGFVNLGCPKALVDSERILAQLRPEGYEIAPSYEDGRGGRGL